MAASRNRPDSRFGVLDDLIRSTQALGCERGGKRGRAGRSASFLHESFAIVRAHERYPSIGRSALAWPRIALISRAHDASEARRTLRPRRDAWRRGPLRAAEKPQRSWRARRRALDQVSGQAALAAQSDRSLMAPAGGLSRPAAFAFHRECGAGRYRDATGEAGEIQRSAQRRRARTAARGQRGRERQPRHRLLPWRPGRRQKTVAAERATPRFGARGEVRRAVPDGAPGLYLDARRSRQAARDRAHLSADAGAYPEVALPRHGRRARPPAGVRGMARCFACGGRGLAVIFGRAASSA